jgi:predicted transcriptional regulator
MPKDQEEFENGIEFSLSSGEEFKQACIDIKALSLYLNGKIVAVSDFEVEKITTFKDYTGYEEYDTHYQTAKRDYERLLQETCLNNQQLDDYLQGENGYAIHIENLYKFIKPKELKDLYVKGAYHNAEQMFTDEIKINGEWFHPMTRAPQNMCYAFDKNGNKYVLISVHPEWLAMILNGLKTIEVRRKVLKEML